MTQQKESIIKSSSISIGSDVRSDASRKTPPQSWNILIISDLGFESAAAERVRASEWNDFMATRNIVLRGTVEPQEIKPFFIDYPVSALSDLSYPALIKNIPALEPLLTVRSILDELDGGTINARRAIDLLSAPNLPVDIVNPIRSLLNASLSGGDSAVSSSPKKSSIDSILSSISGAEAAPRQSTPTDSLFQAISERSAPAIPRDALAMHRSQIGQLIDRHLAAVMQAPFFARRKSSWLCLRQLVQTAGRSGPLSIQAYSAPIDSAVENVAVILDACAQQEASPDLIVWDYPVSTSTASIERFSAVAESADRHKAVVIASLDPGDAALKGIEHAASVGSLLAQPEFIALKRLARQPVARNIILCGPSIELHDSDASSERLQIRPLLASAGWLLAQVWAEKTVSGLAPFALDEITTGESLESRLFSPVTPVLDIAKSSRSEAADAGLTLIGSANGRPHAGKVATLIDRAEVAVSYTYFGFNLLVNRVIRLAGRWVLNNEPDGESLRNYLRSQLEPYGIVSVGDIDASVDNKGTVKVTVDAHEPATSYPIRFQFDFS